MSKSPNLIVYTTDIVSAFVANTNISREDLPKLIQTVHQTISLLHEETAPEQEVELKQPAVPIKKSITDEFLICLEDGKRFKSLKRHLRTKYNLSPEDYRAKWGLARDYPMVAPAYAAARSALAKKIGLGQNDRVQAPVAPVRQTRARKSAIQE